ncbi:MAG: transcription-repair coupling factor, partial [Nocardioides sp.]|nr:transcription-repair coupling factor [Nocardioides sp.]
MADAKALSTLDLTGPAALQPFVVKGLVDAGRTVLAVTATAREAEDLVRSLGDLVDPSAVALYPSWETLPHERLSPRSDTVGRRLAVLRRLRHPGDDVSNGPLSVVVAPVRSILQPQVKGLADLEPVELVTGASEPLDDVVRRLADAAYSRVDLVEKRGEFAVRGGIVDVFPPTEEHPLRVEFWGDDIEEIRSFSVADQRTLDKVERLWAPPCRELLLTDEVRQRAAELGTAHPQLVELTDKIAAGIAVEGMESLAPVLVDEMELLVDLLPVDTHVLVLDPERARRRAHDLVATSDEFLGASWAAAAGGGTAPIDLGAASYREIADVRAYTLAAGKAWWSVSPFGIDLDEGELGQPADDGAVTSRALPARPAEAYRGDIEQAIRDIAGWLSEGMRVVVVHEGHGPAERMVEALGEHDVPARLVEVVGGLGFETGAARLPQPAAEAQPPQPAVDEGLGFETGAARLPQPAAAAGGVVVVTTGCLE